MNLPALRAWWRKTMTAVPGCDEATVDFEEGIVRHLVFRAHSTLPRRPGFGYVHMGSVGEEVPNDILARYALAQARGQCPYVRAHTTPEGAEVEP